MFLTYVAINSLNLRFDLGTINIPEKKVNNAISEAEIMYGLMNLLYDNPEDKWDWSGIHFTRGGPWIDGMDTSGLSNLSDYEMLKNLYESKNK